MSKLCNLCNEPMPPGEEMFNYHGYSGPCPLPDLNFRPIIGKAQFKHTRVLKRIPGDYCLCDPDFVATCGYMSMVECAILYKLTKACRGWWTEMGGHTGWSAAHVAAAGNDIITVDPDYNTPMLARAAENIANCGLARFVNYYSGTSDQFFSNFPTRRFEPFGMVGCVIDGHHTAPHPLNDAKNALLHLAPKGAIFFHDYSLASVKEGVDWLLSHGMRGKVYDTMNGLAVCWRGNLEIP